MNNYPNGQPIAQDIPDDDDDHEDRNADECDGDDYQTAELVPEQTAIDFYADPIPTDMVFDVSDWTKLIFESQLHEDWSAMNATACLMHDPAWTSFVREVFGRAYDIGCDRKADTRPEHEWAVKAHALVEDLPEWKDIERFAKHDEFMAAEAAAATCAVLRERIPDDELGDAQEEQQYMEDLKALGDPSEYPGLEEAVENQQQRINTLSANAQAAAAALGEDQADTRSELRTALQAVLAEANERDEAMAGMGFSKNDRGRSQRIKVIKQLRDNPQLAAILRLAGRMRLRAIAQQGKTKMALGTGEVVSIETGGDLSRLIPMELASLASKNRMRRAQAFARLIERNALQYRVATRVRMDKGPIVFVVDESGSMSGECNTYAKAAMLGMLQVALIQRRAFGIVHFASAYQLESAIYNKGTGPTPDQVIDHASHFFCGGTDIQAALQSAEHMIATSTELGKADIVLLTDAAIDDDEDALASKVLAGSPIGLHVIRLSSAGERKPPLLEKAAESWVDIDPAALKLEACDGVFSI